MLFGLSSLLVQAFQLPQNPSKLNFSSTTLYETSDGRRQFLTRGAGAAMSLLVGGTFMGKPAEASYTGYTQREQDWQTRSEKGEVQISNAAQLRRQLREIAPMNGEGIFCPNGASAAVTPLMENRCGERQALPSVYGRADDLVGNSVPGFGTGASAAAMRAELKAQSYFREN